MVKRKNRIWLCRYSLICWLVVISVISLLAGCSSTISKPTSQKLELSANITFGSLAKMGEQIFSGYCALCHDVKMGGTAPALWGTRGDLTKYGTALELLDFISLRMPPTSPGKLSQKNYLELLSYILIKNNYVNPEKPFDDSHLAELLLD